MQIQFTDYVPPPKTMKSPVWKIPKPFEHLQMQDQFYPIQEVFENQNKQNLLARCKQEAIYFDIRISNDHLQKLDFFTIRSLGQCLNA